jgi:hypothetical protein
LKSLSRNPRSSVFQALNSDKCMLLSVALRLKAKLWKNSKTINSESMNRNRLRYIDPP